MHFYSIVLLLSLRCPPPHFITFLSISGWTWLAWASEDHKTVLIVLGSTAGISVINMSSFNLRDIHKCVNTKIAKTRDIAEFFLIFFLVWDNRDLHLPRILFCVSNSSSAAGLCCLHNGERPTSHIKSHDQTKKSCEAASVER